MKPLNTTLDLEIKRRRGSACLFSRCKPPHVLTCAAAVGNAMCRPKTSFQIVMDLSSTLKHYGAKNAFLESLDLNGNADKCKGLTFNSNFYIGSWEVKQDSINKNRIHDRIGIISIWQDRSIVRFYDR